MNKQGIRATVAACRDLSQATRTNTNRKTSDSADAVLHKIAFCLIRHNYPVHMLNGVDNPEQQRAFHFRSNMPFSKALERAKTKTKEAAQLPLNSFALSNFNPHANTRWFCPALPYPGNF